MGDRGLGLHFVLDVRGTGPQRVQRDAGAAQQSVFAAHHVRVTAPRRTGIPGRNGLASADRDAIQWAPTQEGQLEIRTRWLQTQAE